MKTTKEYYCRHCRRNFKTQSHALLNGAPHTAYDEIIIIKWFSVSDVEQLQKELNVEYDKFIDDISLAFAADDGRINLIKQRFVKFNNIINNFKGK